MKTFNTIILLTGLLLVIPGCAINQWHCQSDIPVVVDGCLKAQMSAMKALPMECVNGADAKGSISAQSTKSGFTRHRGEAEIECRVR